MRGTRRDPSSRGELWGELLTSRQLALVWLGLNLVGYVAFIVFQVGGGTGVGLALVLAVPATAALNMIPGIWIVGWRNEAELRRREHLAASLEAQAKLEMARVVEQVAKDVSEAGSPDYPSGDTAVPNAAGPERPSPDRLTTVGEAGAIAGAVDRFYAEALVQSRVWFLASVVAALAGLVVIVWEVVQASSHPDLEAGLKAATGLLVEAVAALFYRQANGTRKHAGDLLTSTQGDRRAETARQILSTIEDDGRREEIAARLALHLAGAAPAAPRRRSATRPAAAPGRGPQPAPAAEAEPGSVE